MSAQSSPKRQRTGEEEEKEKKETKNVIIYTLNEDTEIEAFVAVFQDEEQFDAFSEMFSVLQRKGKFVGNIPEFLDPKNNAILSKWTPEMTKQEFVITDLWDFVDFSLMKNACKILGFERMKQQFFDQTLVSYERIDDPKEYDGKIHATRIVCLWE